MKFVFKTLLLCILWQGISAQNADNISFPNLYLSNQQVKLNNSDLTESAYPVYVDRYYAIIQSRHDITTVKALTGLEMLYYLPVNGGIFRISSQIKVSELAADLANIEAVISPLKPEWKLSKRLAQNDIPNWAWVEVDKIKVWLSYLPGISATFAKQQLLQDGFRVMEEKADQNLLAVAVKPAETAKLSTYGFIYYVQEMEDPGQPENSTSRTNQRVNTLQSVYTSSPYYDGSGVVVGLGDDGEIGPHIDYKGRLSQNAGNSNGDHGDHVAGTIFGAGNLDPKGRGMAPGADIYYQTYPNNLSDADQNYTNRNVRVTNSSYSNGCNAGYTLFTQQMDQDIIDNPKLLHVFSAGNNGSSDCNYGAGSGWGNVTGGHKIAKNVIAVANVTYTDALANSSSRGPAADGRIKPDVAAVGSSVFSTTNPNAYTLKTGTSMSAPAVAGAAAVLYDAYRDYNNSQDPPSGLVKAIMMNSADDLGNPGPDFRFGYGRVNIQKAYQIVKNSQFYTSAITNSGSNSHLISVPANTAEVKIMLYWSDPPATTFASRSLVNDLDITATQGGTTYQPWVLDPTPISGNLNSNAVRSRDSLNNMEQVTILNPASGDISINVSGFNIPMGAQNYYLVYYFEEAAPVLTYPLGGEGFVPGQTEVIRWDAPSGTSSFKLEYSSDGGANWNIISNSIASNRRYYNWNVPNQIGSNYKIRLSRGNVTDQSPGTFTIIGRPANITIVQICPDTLKLNWNPVAGASGYVVYSLGTKYMDSIGFTQATYFDVPVNNLNQEQWYSVAAVVNGKAGLRANAIERTQSGLFNCTVINDMATNKVLSPPSGLLSDCYSYSNIPVKLEVENKGIQNVNSFTVNYSLNGAPPVSETVTNNLVPGAIYIHQFSGNGLTFNSNSSNTLKTWVVLNNDGNSYNDTNLSSIITFNSDTVSFPYSQNFENYNTCSTNTDCGATTCTLSDNWFNAINGSMDDIDFRTNSGTTASSNTGPTADHNPGNSSGKYLYLEASGGCDSALAVLMSPCIDLRGANMPVLEFWYHMYGANMGTLSLNIFDGDEWHENIIPKISGNKGNQWIKARINLLPFAGDIITLRFKGKTGNGFSSDIAIDDINLFENTQSPSALFLQDNQQSCINGVVNFTDASTNVPTSWNWQISPSTYNFTNGTSASSQDVSVQFTAVGTYNVQLIATNVFGSDTSLVNQSVVIDAGMMLPVFEDFEGSLFPPQDWQISNPDNQSAWQRATVVEADGLSGKAALFDNFNSGASFQEDGLITMNLDLRNINDGILTFDVAHAQANGSNDSLTIEYSANCGLDFQPTSYAKGGNSLATTTITAGKFTPSSAQHWRKDSVDLSSLAGQNIMLNFRNKSSAGNAVYIDNIQLVSSSVTAPVAFFSASEDSLVCKNQTVVFTDSLSGGMADSIYWNFGLNAVPPTANGSGPHSVSFIRDGQQNITLRVSNSGGLSTYTRTLRVETTPVAVFSSNVVNPQVIQFNDLSLYSPTSWLWKFGDGDSSTAQNPQHTYAAGGTYTVTLDVANSCGTTNRQQVLVISGIGIDEKIGLDDIWLYPNPGTGLYYLNFNSAVGQDLKVEVMDLSARLIKVLNTETRSGKNEMLIDISDHPAGMYMIRIITDTGTETVRAVKN